MKKVMIGMLLVGYQLKNEIIEACTNYERDKNPSISSIVEDFLEDFLRKKGYLEDNIDVDKIIAPIEAIESESEHNFKKGKKRTGKSGNSVEVLYGDLSFGWVKEDDYYDIVDKLMDFSYDELKEISKTNWEGNLNTYRRFLKRKLENPNLKLDDFLSENRFNIYNRGVKGWQIVYRRFSICTSHDEKEFEKIKKFLFKLPDSELDSLISKLENCNNRREFVLNYMDSHKLEGVL